MRFGCWEELVGRLKAVKENGDGTVTLVFEIHGRTIEVVVLGAVETFKPFIGKRMGLLRTDNPAQPYRIRVIG